VTPTGACRKIPAADQPPEGVLDHGVARLLSDVEVADVTPAPFAHLVRKPALPPAVYDRLATGFPGLEVVLGRRRAVGSNVAVRMTVQAVLSAPGIPSLWREFFEYHTSAVYWKDVVRLFAAAFRREFPGLEARLGRAYEDWRVVPRGADGPAEVRLDCQFVMNTPVTAVSSVKTPHVDLADKIFSALLYFRDPADASSGGDLDLYRWRRPPRFVKHRVLDRDVERVDTVTYAANTYVAFVNSAASVHGVSPRSVTAVPRRYVNFIAELAVPAFTPKQVSRFRRLLLAGGGAGSRADDRY
jgi:hypothetical protein